jgi:hypothetical protein
MQQAMERGIILNGLFGYIDGYTRSDFMQPFAGYFMKANQPCTLLIPVDNAVAVSPAERARYAALPKPSLAQVAAELRGLGLDPAARSQGVSQPVFGPVRPAPARRQPFPTNSLLELWPWRPQRG